MSRAAHSTATRLEQSRRPSRKSSTISLIRTIERRSARPRATLEEQRRSKTPTIPPPTFRLSRKTNWHPSGRSETPVLCAPGRGPLDEAVAIILTQLLNEHGLGARVEGVEAIASTNIYHLETAGVAMICVSYLDASSLAHMRYTIRRLCRRFPKARIMLGCWMANARYPRTRKRQARRCRGHAERCFAPVFGGSPKACRSSIDTDQGRCWRRCRGLSNRFRRCPMMTTHGRDARLVRR